ncbi:MAG TPA: peroxide stress protein YaaA [Mycobacteriales bacterium]|nr:peroxide stress protein YaaA [Mycobacteriales bacterium]
MLVLLPPSEAKSSGGDGPPVDLATLSWLALTAVRERVARTLATVCQGNAERARKRLGLSLALDDDRAANAELWASPTMPAGARYSGILHDALGYPTLPAAARKRAADSVVVFSGLWGATRPTDLLPAYRIGIGTQLPRIGPLPALWRKPLHGALDEQIGDEGAIDLRSSGYSLMYRPSTAAAPKLIAVKITGPDGKRAAASYQSKVAKGRLVREMVRGAAPSLDGLLIAAKKIGVSADGDAAGVVVRLPAGWGLAGSPTAAVD